MRYAKLWRVLACGAVLSSGVPARAQAPMNGIDRTVDTWVSATGRAAGADEKARDQAVAAALRKAVEEACGVFLTAQSKTRDYKAIHDKILANTVGYVREHKVDSVTVHDGVTVAKVRARVSTRKFEEDWASIRHTIEQENNPRVVVGIVEAVHQTTGGATFQVKEAGAVQSRVEDFFLSKGLSLMDRQTAKDVSKRDILLATIKDDTSELASLGARFKADVVVSGRATAKFGKEFQVADQTLYQYTATLTVRVVQSDSGRVLASKSFDPVTVNTLQRSGGEDKALAKLGEQCAPKLLAAVVKAWKNRANVHRSVQIMVSGMDFEMWKTFKKEAGAWRGVKALRLREITESVATIDVECRDTNEILAELLSEMKTIKLKVVEITANRIKLKVLKKE